MRIIRKILETLSPTYRRMMYIIATLHEVGTKQDNLKMEITEIKRQNVELVAALRDVKEDLSTTQDTLVNQQKFQTDISKMPSATGILRDIQNISFEMLQEIDRICKKHNLEYWLDFGTLLGAERHKGFIPWDDDMDISMMKADYDRLLSVVDIELADTNFCFVRVPSNIGKVVHRSFIPKGEVELAKFIHWDMHDKIVFALDIFPYYYAKKPLSNQTLKRNIEVAASKKASLFDKDKTYGAFHKASKIVNGLHKKLASDVASERIFMGLETIPDRLATKPWIVDTKTIFPLSRLVFEGFTFPVPRNTQLYLTEIYRDYTQLPIRLHDHLHLSTMPVTELKKVKEVINK